MSIEVIPCYLSGLPDLGLKHRPGTILVSVAHDRASPDSLTYFSSGSDMNDLSLSRACMSVTLATAPPGWFLVARARIE